MLPKKYEFLDNIGTLPKLVAAGLQYLGIREIPGAKSNPVIMDMAKALGVDNIYTNDDTSWCALWISFLCKITGKPMPYKQYDILRAASFATWGDHVSPAEVQLGDIVVFKRPGGNHVGIAIAVSKNIDGKIGTIHVLGANQSNSVSIAEITVNRLSNVRRFYATQAPESAKQYVIDSSGVMSVNES